ncbi:MAG: SNF2-related protein [Verrucomicrobiota bacterium]|nr:SNF2-related protein [Verrucomicrobiota bacterium]
MQYAPGQRWISESQPEMGLGIVLQADSSTVTLLFPASEETRTYSSASAPLRRVVFSEGDIIELKDGTSLVVESLVDNEEIISYCGSGRTVSESELANEMGFHQPDARLLGGRVNSSRKFHLRERALDARAQMRGRRERGLMGARMNLIAHQLFIADEVGRRHNPRVLLADEVGLGKTIEACLIMHRKLITGSVSRVLILVPEPLVHQWFIELLRRFNLQFAIFDEERCVAIETGGAEEGIDGQPDAAQKINPFLDDQLVLAGTELLAGNPARVAQAIDAGWDMVIVDEAHHLQWTPEKASNEYAMVEQLSSVTRDLLLLTGTPGQLSPEGHFARLRLLDPDRFHDLEKFQNESKDAAAVSAMAGKLQSGTPLDAREQKQVAKWIGGELPGNSDQLLERLLDLHGTGRVLFRNRRANLGGFPQREITMYPLDKDDQVEEDPRVDWLIGLVGQLGDEKVLVICRTLEMVEELEAAISAKIRIKTALFHEGLELIKRDRNAAYFSEEDGARLLICSEIGSEGRNFQFAHHLVLYDLPETPALLEQRIGRLDRIGQQDTIRIHVPFASGSAHGVLARWYHEGMDAFARPMEGGTKLMEKFHTRMQETATDDLAGWESIIADTQAAKEELDAMLEAGRDRLLEMSSFNAQAAKEITSAIAGIDADNSLEKLMIDFFDALGVGIEELGDYCYYVKPDTVFAGDAFPGMREIGMSITFDRDTALVNEQMSFVSWDHPIVSTSLDLIINGEQGSSAFGQIPGTAAQAGLIVECIFLLEPICPPGLGADRFLPPVPIKAVVDHSGNDITGSFDSSAVKDGNRSWLRSKLEILGKMVPAMVVNAEKCAEKNAVRLRKEALKQMNTEIADQLDRLERLTKLGHPVRGGEIEAAQEEREALKVHLANAPVRLDSIRLVVIGG